MRRRKKKPDHSDCGEPYSIFIGVRQVKLPKGIECTLIGARCPKCKDEIWFPEQAQDRRSFVWDAPTGTFKKREDLTRWPKSIR